MDVRSCLPLARKAIPQPVSEHENELRHMTPQHLQEGWLRTSYPRAADGISATAPASNCRTGPNPRRVFDRRRTAWRRASRSRCWCGSGTGTLSSSRASGSVRTMLTCVALFRHCCLREHCADDDERGPRAISGDVVSRHRLPRRATLVAIGSSAVRGRRAGACRDSAHKTCLVG